MGKIQLECVVNIYEDCSFIQRLCKGKNIYPYITGCYRKQRVSQTAQELERHL